MIKVVHIISKLTYGGAERLLLDICRKIDKDDFDISVITLKKNNQLLQQFTNAGIKVKVFDKKNKFDLKVIDRIADYLKHLKPDIVHTHLFGGDYWGGMAARQAGIKNIVSTKHDTLSEGFFRNHLGRKARHKAKRIIAISEAVKVFLINKEHLSYDNVELIYNGIDMNKFYDQEARIFKDETLYLGAVGRLSKEKGQKHLLKACRFLKNRDWRLQIVGDGDMRRELEDLADLLDIKDNVTFTGAVADVRPYLDKMDVFVLTSYSEGLSLAILEAAAAGKVVVATKVGGVPEIVRHKDNGFLFPPKNIEKLLDCLNWIDQNRDEAKKMAKKLQREVAEKFDINNTIKKYEAFYREVLSEK